MGATSGSQPPPKSAGASARHRPRWTWPLDEYVAERAAALTSGVGDTAGAGLYLEGRGIANMVQLCGIGYDNGWLTFPITSSDASTLGVVARALPGRASQTSMRYDMPPEQGPMMYVPDWRAIKDAPEIFVTFGIIDAISLNMVGMAACTSTAGKGSFNPDWLADISRPISIVPDRDEDATAFALAARLDWRGRTLRLDWPAGTDDPNDILAKHGLEALRDAVDSSLRSSGRSNS